MKGVLFILQCLVIFLPMHALANNCDVPTVYQDLIKCAEVRSTEIQSATVELERAKARVQSAAQWQNPELSGQTVQGKIGSESRSETDLALGIPIEIGGKISARTAGAKAEVLVAEARLIEAQSTVRADIFLKLHRLRQVLHEQEVLREAMGTFAKLIDQYAKRPGLSPEQKLSASVFKLARSEYEIKLNLSQDEVLELDSYFQLKLEKSTEQIKKLLPQSPKTWPSLPSAASTRPSIQSRILQGELEASQAELDLAKSEAWPTLTVGPSLKILNEAGQTNQLVGVNVSFPLPVFNLNSGARASAAASVLLSQNKKKLGMREQELKRTELIKVYEQSVKTLTGSISHAEIEKRHAEAEKLFGRGVVPSSLVIESHRTSLELEKARHERELKALETLLSIYAIDAAILEVNL